MLRHRRFETILSIVGRHLQRRKWGKTLAQGGDAPSWPVAPHQSMAERSSFAAGGLGL
jgi:hypothetical protein